MKKSRSIWNGIYYLQIQNGLCIQQLCQMRLLSCCIVLVQQTLCASLVNTLDSNLYCSFLVSSVCCASDLSLLDHGLQIGLSCLVGSSLCLVNLYSLLGRLDIRHFCAPPLFVLAAYKYAITV